MATLWLVELSNLQKAVDFSIAPANIFLSAAISI